MSGTPIQITFYNPDDSIKKEYVKSHIPCGLLDTVLELQEAIDEENITKETTAAIYGFIVSAFGDQFGIEELKKCASLEEMISVIEMISAKTQNSIGRLSKETNPTTPGSKPRSRHKAARNYGSKPKSS
jgi:hypothetical protein